MCPTCRSEVDEHSIIRAGDRIVCTLCKDQVVQCFKEGVSPELIGNQDLDFSAELKSRMTVWEKRRLLYNAILLVVTLCSSAFGVVVVNDGQSFQMASLLFSLPVWCVVANVLFLAGPLVDLYASAFIVDRKEVGQVLFVAGTVLASFLACFISVFSV